MSLLLEGFCDGQTTYGGYTLVPTGRVSAVLHPTFTPNAPDAPSLPLAVAMREFSRLVTSLFYSHFHRY